jgi:hypothetical protein
VGGVYRFKTIKGRRKKEEGRRKKEEGRRKSYALFDILGDSQRAFFSNINSGCAGMI